MNTIIKKLISKKEITDRDIGWALYEICDNVHSTCDNKCPVFEKNNGVPLDKDGYCCICFKDGTKMLKFLRGKK